MVPPAAGSVVLVRFPFSDLSQIKLRPAIVLTDAGRKDWILCQVTSNAYADPLAIEITNADLKAGSLNRTSYARPGKIFTANETLMASQVGTLTEDSFKQKAGAVIGLLQASLSP